MTKDELAFAYTACTVLAVISHAFISSHSHLEQCVPSQCRLQSGSPAGANPAGIVSGRRTEPAGPAAPSLRTGRLIRRHKNTVTESPRKQRTECDNGGGGTQLTGVEALPHVQATSRREVSVQGRVVQACQRTHVTVTETRPNTPVTCEPPN